MGPILLDNPGWPDPNATCITLRRCSTESYLTQIMKYNAMEWESRITLGLNAAKKKKKKKPRLPQKPL